MNPEHNEGEHEAPDPPPTHPQHPPPHPTPTASTPPHPTPPTTPIPRLATGQLSDNCWGWVAPECPRSHNARYIMLNSAYDMNYLVSIFTMPKTAVDFTTISVPLTCAHINVLCVAIVTSWVWMVLWRHCWRRQWLGWVHYTDWEWVLGMECPLRFTSYFVLFSYSFIFHIIKGIRNVCPCVVEFRVTSGCALATSLHPPTGSLTKAQPCVPLISTMHGQPFWIP